MRFTCLEQKGGNIVGEFAADHYGILVSISHDGQIFFMMTVKVKCKCMNSIQRLLLGSGLVEILMGNWQTVGYCSIYIGIG